MHEVAEHLVLVRSKRHGLPCAGHAAAAGVQRPVATLQHRRRLPAGAADQRAQACQQLFEVKGLGQIVIGTRINARHLLVPVVPRGEDQHRHVAPLGPPALEHREPIHHRQAQVQHHGIHRFGLAQKLRVSPVVGLVHGVARTLQRGAQLGEQLRVVFYEEDAHGL
ncbi:hypothetical protein D3C72_1375500 [compost metagenome]